MQECWKCVWLNSLKRNRSPDNQNQAALNPTTLHADINILRRSIAARHRRLGFSAHVTPENISPYRTVASSYCVMLRANKSGKFHGPTVSTESASCRPHSMLSARISWLLARSKSYSCAVSARLASHSCGRNGQCSRVVGSGHGGPSIHPSSPADRYLGWPQIARETIEQIRWSL
jgi:hypothetical protein